MSAERRHPTMDATAMVHVLCPRCRTVNRLPSDRPAGKAKCGACHDPLFHGSVTPVDEAAFADHLRRNGIPVLVDMWAPWCGPCRTMAPMFERAAQTLEPEVRLLKLNVDEAQASAARFGVRGVPALLLFQHGHVLGQSSGVRNADAIVRWVRAHLSPPTAPEGGFNEYR